MRRLRSFVRKPLYELGKLLGLLCGSLCGLCVTLDGATRILRLLRGLHSLLFHPYALGAHRPKLALQTPELRGNRRQLARKTCRVSLCPVVLLARLGHVGLAGTNALTRFGKALFQRVHTIPEQANPPLALEGT